MIPCFANVSASRAAFKSERTIRIFPPDLYISLDYGNKKFKVCSRKGGVDALGFPKLEVVERKVEDRDALEDEIESFLDCVATRAKPIVSGRDGMRALELVQQIRDAFEESYQRLDAGGEFSKQVGNFS